MEMISVAVLCFMTFNAFESGMISSGQGQLFLFITFLINIFVQIYRERRQRKWDLADREEAKRQLADHETKMVKKVDEQTKAITNTVAVKVDEKINEQTDTLTQSMRTRVADFGKNMDTLITDAKRRKDD